MNSSLGQGYAVMFQFKVDKTESETHEIIESTYGDDVIGWSTIVKWLKLFCEGQEQTEDDQRSRQASTTNSNKNLVNV